MTMAKVFTCSCGMRTTEPFYIGGRMVCTVCAETEAPHIVSRRAAMNWREFMTMGRKVPTSRISRNWEGDLDVEDD